MICLFPHLKTTFFFALFSLSIGSPYSELQVFPLLKTPKCFPQPAARSYFVFYFCFQSLSSTHAIKRTGSINKFYTAFHCYFICSYFAKVLPPLRPRKKCYKSFPVLSYYAPLPSSPGHPAKMFDFKLHLALNKYRVARLFRIHFFTKHNPFYSELPKTWQVFFLPHRCLCVPSKQGVKCN